MFGLKNIASMISGSRSVDTASTDLTVAARTVLVKRPAMQAKARSAFKGASIDRLQSSWMASGKSNDSAIRAGLRVMRSRSRQLFYDNEYAKQFIRILKNNVIGHQGIVLKARALDERGDLDRADNLKIETSWSDWSKRGMCDVTGQLSFRDVCGLALETTARDGEVLVRKHVGFPTRFGFALELLESDLLDETITKQLPNGNMIRQGIEFDQYGKRVAFYLFAQHPGDYVYGSQSGNKHIRIPADQIIHLYLPEFVRQSRAVPWIHAGMSRLKKMDDYEWAEMIAALISASKMAFYEMDPDADPEFFDDDEDDEGEFFEEVEAGTFGIVPRGYRLKEFDPQHPAGNFDPFMKRNLRGFSAGAGVNYVSVGNDLSEVNFSSIRFGTEEDRDFFKTLQRWLIEWLCDDVFQSWLPAAMLSGALQLPFSRIDKFRRVSWRPRRWSYINPIQDAAANEKKLKSGQTTLTQLHAENGSDYGEYLEDLKEEEKLEEEYQVKPPMKVEAETKAKNKGVTS